MITIETQGTITPDGQLSVKVPREIVPGEHRVVVVIEEKPVARQTHARPLPAFPVVDLGPWPGDISLRREDIYGDGDDGR